MRSIDVFAFLVAATGGTHHGSEIVLSPCGWAHDTAADGSHAVGLPTYSKSKTAVTVVPDNAVP